MALDLLLQQFDGLIQTPADVKKLEQTILQWAVMGRLVPQNADDEPASVLLERITAEKARLVKEKMIRKGKKLPPIAEDEVPFEVPSSWRWVCLPQIGLINPRNSANDDLDVSFVPMSLIPTEYDNELRFEKRKWKTIRKGYTHFKDSDVVFAKITPCFQNRKSVVMRNLVNGIGAGTTELHVFRGDPQFIDPDYVLLFFKSPHFINIGVSKMTGTAGHKRVPKLYFQTVPFPLPPIEEQKRIVARVDELFEQTRTLAAQLEAAQEARTRLQRAVVAQIVPTTRISHPATSPNRRLEDIQALLIAQFDPLHSQAADIDTLKQTILQLAVMGRLVPQNADDEPASVLLERITVEKARLVREKKIRKGKKLPPIAEDEVPFEVPSGWKWAHLNDVILELPRNGYSPKTVKYETSVRRLTLSATTSGKFLAKHFKYVDVDIDPDSHLWLMPNDILIQRSNSLRHVGISAVYDGIAKAFIYPDLMMKIRAFEEISVHYLHLALLSSTVRQYFRENASGTSGSMPKINQKVVSLAPIPIPSYDEQKRIVARVDELFALCDELAAQLQAAEAVRGRFLDALLAQAASG